MPPTPDLDRARPRADADRPSPPPPEAQRTRNFRLGVANGVLFQAGEGMIDSNTVIPVFLSRLTSSNALIGLGSALSDLGWFLPQFVVTPLVARAPRQLWLYRRAGVMRGASLAILAVLIWLLARDHPRALLAAFLVFYPLYCVGGGIAGPSFMEIVGKIVPHGRLGSFWSARLFWGGALAALSGLVVGAVLRLEDPGLKYGLLMALAGILVSCGWVAFASVKEPEGRPDPSRSSPRALLAEGFALLREDPPFRRLFLSRATLSLWLTASPFMVLFAVDDLRAGARAAGTFLFARVAGMVLSNLWWSPLSRRLGNRAVMRSGTLAGAGVSLGVALVALLSPWKLGVLPAGVAILLLEALAFLGGAAQAAMIVAYASLVITLAPPARRQSFVALMNSFIGVTLLLPPLGGALVDWFNAPVVFALCGLASLFGYSAATRLPEGRGVAEAGLAGPVDAVSTGGGD